MKHLIIELSNKESEVEVRIPLQDKQIFSVFSRANKFSKLEAKIFIDFGCISEEELVSSLDSISSSINKEMSHMVYKGYVIEIKFIFNRISNSVDICFTLPTDVEFCYYTANN